MKRTIFTLLACAAILFASCDKIDENNYIVYSGLVGEWFDGEGVSDHTQRAIIEKYTGVRCLNCPVAEDAINDIVAQNQGRLFAVAIHDSSSFGKPYSGNPDLRSAVGDAWSHYFGIFDAGQYPTAIVNRTLLGNGWDIFNPISNINSHVNPILNSPASVAISVDAEKEESSVSITVNLEFLENVGDKLNITLFVIEDNINATQLMPDGTKNDEYIHNHVLREVITDLWGAEVDCTGAAGEKRYSRFNYLLNEENSYIILANAHIVAMLTNRLTGEVVNVAECSILPSAE